MKNRHILAALDFVVRFFPLFLFVALVTGDCLGKNG